MKKSIQAAADLLKASNLTIAFAESATAGRLTSEFAMANEAGVFLKGGLACYNVELKEQLLDVPHSLIEKCTPESPEVTLAITQGLVNLINADVHVGVTGLPATGGSETPTKPVGTMFIHALLNGRTLFVDRTVYSGDQTDIVLQTIERVAELLIVHLTPTT